MNMNKDTYEKSAFQLLINETTEDYLYGLLLSIFIEDFIFEECIEMIWLIRADLISLDNIYNIKPIESYFIKEKHHNIQHTNNNNLTISCPICTELISGKRFAPHLEKCMNGGIRGSKRHYDYLHDNNLAMNSLLKNIKPKQIDLYPNSLIVKIKVINGTPKANSKRLGATLDEFELGDSDRIPKDNTIPSIPSNKSLINEDDVI